MPSPKESIQKIASRTRRTFGSKSAQELKKAAAKEDEMEMKYKKEFMLKMEMEHKKKMAEERRKKQIREDQIREEMELKQAELEDRNDQFDLIIRDENLGSITEVAEGGNALYRALSDQLYQDGGIGHVKLKIELDKCMMHRSDEFVNRGVDPKQLEHRVHKTSSKNSLLVQFFYILK